MGPGLNFPSHPTVCVSIPLSRNTVFHVSVILELSCKALFDFFIFFIFFCLRMVARYINTFFLLSYYHESPRFVLRTYRLQIWTHKIAFSEAVACAAGRKRPDICCCCAVQSAAVRCCRPVPALHRSARLGNRKPVGRLIEYTQLYTDTHTHTHTQNMESTHV